MIEKEIKGVMKALGIDRMPSSVEIERVMNNSALSNAIAKRGGFNLWSKKLNLTQSKCETRIGQAAEYYIKDLLTSKGYKAEKMSVKHPYDLLINDNIKIDIKASHIYKGIHGEYHTFNLEKSNPTCDIYIFLCIESNKILIIPSVFLHQTQIAIGKNSKYDSYKDRWDYIDQYDRFYESVI